MIFDHYNLTSNCINVIELVQTPALVSLPLLMNEILYSADVSGDIGPFQVAIALTVVSLVMIIFWPENYGGGNEDQKMVWMPFTTITTNSIVFVYMQKLIAVDILSGSSSVFFNAEFHVDRPRVGRKESRGVVPRAESIVLRRGCVYLR